MWHAEIDEKYITSIFKGQVVLDVFALEDRTNRFS
jgi:hypothetical protein